MPDDITILHLSDFHFRKNETTKVKFLDKLSKQVFDLILITGDLAEYKEAMNNCISKITNLKSIYGTYISFGNHDHYQYRWYSVLLSIIYNNKNLVHNSLTYIFDDLIKKIEKTNIKMLINKNTTVKIRGKNINLCGIDDYYAGNPSLEEAFSNINLNNFTILLSHRPDVISNEIASKADLILSGHTHGGQIILPFLTTIMMKTIGISKLYKEGLYLIDKKTKRDFPKLYICSGIGTSRFHNFRLFSPPSVAIIKIKFTF